MDANCKKALAICLQQDSPWRDFEGHYPSGKTWFDYIEWLRIQMYRATNDCPTTDILDVDLDEQPTEDADDAEETAGTQPTKQSEKNRKDADDSDLSYNLDDAKNDEDQHDEEEVLVDKFVDGLLNTETDTEIPENENFKGFWAFALWGYIPPAGYEEYKCALITTVVDKRKKNNRQK